MQGVAPKGSEKSMFSIKGKKAVGAARCKAQPAGGEGAYFRPFSLSREQNQACLGYAEAKIKCNEIMNTAWEKYDVHKTSA